MEGNERADVEAKVAAESGVELSNKVDYNQLIAHLTGEYSNIDRRFLDSLNGSAGKNFRENFSHFNIKFFRKLSLIKRESSIIIRLIAGYSYTGHYLYRLGLRDSPACECGYEDQDINHIYLQCNLYDDIRRILFRDLSKLKCYPPYSMTYLFYILDSKIAKSILNFIK